MDGDDERRLWLSRQLGAPVSWVWTDNRSVMISVKGNAASGYQSADTATVSPSA